MTAIARIIGFNGEDVILYEDRPSTSTTKVTKDEFNNALLCLLPSSRVWYKGLNGERIPYLTWSEYDVKEDIQHWKESSNMLNIRPTPVSISDMSPELQSMSDASRPKNNIEEIILTLNIEKRIPLIERYFREHGIVHLSAKKIAYYPEYLIDYVLHHGCAPVLIPSISMGDWFTDGLQALNIYSEQIYIILTAKDTWFRSIVYMYIRLRKDIHTDFLQTFYKNFIAVANSAASGITKKQFADSLGVEYYGWEKYLEQYLKLWFREKITLTPQVFARQLVEGNRQQSETNVKSLLNNFTDKELKNMFPLHFRASTNRSQLLDDLSYAAITTTPFTFIIPRELADAFCNQETVISTSGYAMSAPETRLVVGFGTFVGGATCYDVEVLTESLRTYPNVIVQPHGRQDARMPLSQLGSIATTLNNAKPIYESDPNIVADIDFINEEYRRRANDTKMGGAKTIREFLEANSDKRNDIAEVFLNIFEMGMYLRRWEGPGQPYPLTETLTEGDTLTNDRALRTAINATVSGAKYGDAIAKINDQHITEVIYGLPLWMKVNNRLTMHTENLQFCLDEMNRDQRCIRMYSGYLAYTGAYYMDIFCEAMPENPPFNYKTDNIAWH